MTKLELKIISWKTTFCALFYDHLKIPTLKSPPDERVTHYIYVTLNLNTYLIRQGYSQSYNNTMIKSLNYYVIVFIQLDYFCLLVKEFENIK